MEICEITMPIFHSEFVCLPVESKVLDLAISIFPSNIDLFIHRCRQYFDGETLPNMCKVMVQLSLLLAFRMANLKHIFPFSLSVSQYCYGKLCVCLKLSG